MSELLLYVDIDEIDEKNISVGEDKKDLYDGKLTIYRIKYQYNTINSLLYVSVNNIKLHNFNGIAQYYDRNILHYDKKFQKNIDFINKVKSIRNKIIDIFINKYTMDIEYLNEMKNKNIHLFVSEKTKIIKLGSKTENNININITSFDDFNNYIFNKSYNRYNSDRYYLANLIVSFNVTMYVHVCSKWRLSFKPFIKSFEFKFNKSKTISNFNTPNNIFISNNILSI